MSEVVNVSMQGEIAVVTVDSPPVNTLSRDVRAGLKECFASLRGRPEVKAVVLACAGKTFLSGGDMREFETGILEPGYHEVLRLIEDSTVPVVAALYGTVMGGGVETAIACHYRVAQEGTKFGLPEITLGIIPGAGGTQRMPRLIGLEPALDMMLSGKPLTAAQAKEVSLVDTVVGADVTAATIVYARELVAAGKGPRRTRERAVAGSEKAGEVIAARRAQLGKTFKNRNSPNVLLDAVQAAVDKPFDEGIAYERSLSSQGRKWSLFEAFKYHEKIRKIVESERKRGIFKKHDFHIFHTIEFHALTFALGFVHPVFFYVFIGMFVHSFLDFIDLAYKKTLYAREFLLVNWIIKKLN